jgi:hypothetical protein
MLDHDHLCEELHTPLLNLAKRWAEDENWYKVEDYHKDQKQILEMWAFIARKTRTSAYTQSGVSTCGIQFDSNIGSLKTRNAQTRKFDAIWGEIMPHSIQQQITDSDTLRKKVDEYLDLVIDYILKNKSVPELQKLREAFPKDIGLINAIIDMDTLLNLGKQDLIDKIEQCLMKKNLERLALSDIHTFCQAMMHCMLEIRGILYSEKDQKKYEKDHGRISELGYKVMLYVENIEADVRISALCKKHLCIVATTFAQLNDERNDQQHPLRKKLHEPVATFLLKQLCASLEYLYYIESNHLAAQHCETTA